MEYFDLRDRRLVISTVQRHLTPFQASTQMQIQAFERGETKLDNYWIKTGKKSEFTIIVAP